MDSATTHASDLNSNIRRKQTHNSVDDGKLSLPTPAVSEFHRATPVLGGQFIHDREHT
jgi:hypothetical protein